MSWLYGGKVSGGTELRAVSGGEWDGGGGRLDQKDVESTGDQSIIRTLCYTHTFLDG